MAKDLSKHQEKIVQRYYEHQETIRAERLSDMVAELWLCEDTGAATKLWGKAQVALMKAGCNPTQVASVVGKRDVAGLAALVQQFDAGRLPPPGTTGFLGGAPEHHAKDRAARTPDASSPRGDTSGGTTSGGTASGGGGAKPLDQGSMVARGARSLADLCEALRA